MKVCKTAARCALVYLGCTSLLLTCGCSSNTATNTVARLDVAPWVLMPDDSALAWNLPVKGHLTEIYAVRDSTPKAVGLFDVPGRWNRPISSDCFISEYASRARDGWHADLYVYDLCARSRRRLGRDITIEHFSRPASPDGKSIVVHLSKRPGGLGVVDLNTGATSVLLRNVWPEDAVWVDSRTVMCAYMPLSDESTLHICRISRGDVTPRELWRRPLGGLGAVRCSPDGLHIAYCRGGHLVCESLRSGRVSPITESHDSSLQDIWSRTGRRLAVWDDGGREALLYDAQRDESYRVRVSEAGKGVVSLLGWFSGDSAFALNTEYLDGKAAIDSVSGPKAR